MPETSIVVKAEDRYSSAVKAMSTQTKAFCKDQEEMERILKRLTKNKYEIKMDLDKAKKELQKLEKQYQKTGSAADKMKLEAGQEKYETMRRNLSLVTREAREAEKQMEKTAETFRRTGNSTAGTGGSSAIVSAIAASGAGQLVGQVLQQGANALVSSAFGTEGGTVFSNALSTAASGAAIGTMIGGAGIGTAVGAAIGAGAGMISGGLQIFEKKDDAFKAHYAKSVETAMAARDAELSAGTGIAAGRETDQISFSTLFGDEQTAKGYLSDLVGMANSTPFLYDDLTAMSKTLATYGYGADGILPVLQTIGDAGAALGMGTGDMSMVATALGRMKSSDKTTLEYLNILNDRGIGAVGMLADYYQVDQGEIYDRISKGKIKGTEAVEIILRALEEDFAGAMKAQSETFAGKTSTLQGLEQELENAMGAAYNESALAGIQGDIEAYDGALGDELKGMNAMIGEGRAMAENLERQYKREALAALTGQGGITLYDEEQRDRLGRLNTEYEALKKEFDTADEARKAELGAKMESLKGQAEALAADAYNASETGIALKDTELELIEAIRENTKALGAAAWDHDYLVEQEKTKGRGAGPSGGPGGSGGAWKPASSYLTGGYAYGLDRVPYDNFPALLHEGERVLTASQARAEDRDGGGLHVEIGSVSFGASVSDPEEAAEIFARRLTRELMLARPD